MNKLLTLAHKRHIDAVELYGERYHSELYQRAIRNKTTAYACLLIDDAMALCGSPHYKVSNRRYSKQALAFLEAFTV